MILINQKAVFRCYGNSWLIATLLCLILATPTLAATYYVSPTGSNSLSTNSSSPGSLSYAVANAASGSTVILENGTYDGTPNGYTVGNSTITFQAQNWHGATVKNSTGSSLWNAASSSVVNDICQGIIFGPSTGLGWSGGGGIGWKFLDCEFVSNGGMGAGNNCLFQHDLFSDSYSNAFDFGGSGQTILNSIARRGNRQNGDDDSIGNKESYTTNFTVNGLVAYDNACPSLWFDTSNDGWLVENSTFFGNHGSENWFTCGVGTGMSTTQFTGYGQDGEGITVGEPILCISGTSANVGHSSVVTSVSGSNPQTITISPALPATPASNDQFAVEHGVGPAGGFITEANDNGTFTNNVAYSNTDWGYFDHSSGGTTYGGSGGLTITHNLFAYNGEGFFLWTDSRDQGSALLEYNQFRFLPGSSSAFDAWGGSLSGYPGSMGITFDYNTYQADNANGSWANWFISNPPAVAGGLTSGSQPSGQDYLQNPSTWNQDKHSTVGSIPFSGTPPSVYVWPASGDTNWSDIYFPNNTFGLSNSIHQINDTNGAVNNTIDAALAGHSVGDVITIPVVAHTSLAGTSCEVYDLNGRWVSLTVNTTDQASFTAAVPAYVTCTTGNATQTYMIKVTLNSLPPYNVTATYSPSGGSGGGALSGSVGSAAASYNLTSVGTGDWKHWGRGTGGSNYSNVDHKTSGGSQISNLTQVGTSGSYGSWNDTSRSVSWSDGTPTASISGDQGYIWQNAASGNQGWSFTAPADTTTRTLTVYAGGNTAQTTLKAHLSDGSAADYSTAQTFSSIGTDVYTLTYHAASAGQALTVTLTKSGNTGGSTNGSVDLDSAWLGGSGGTSGSLTGSEVTASTSTYGLTSLGTADWAHWSSTGLIHKSSGGSQISSVTQVGGGSYGRWSVSTRNVSWSDGTPTASNSDDQSYIWCNGTTGQGWTFTAPASTAAHTLYILCGGVISSPFSAIKLNAHLSDGSAADYTSTMTTTASANLYLYTLTYNAASAGQTVTVTLTKNDSNSSTSVDLDAAWLH